MICSFTVLGIFHSSLCLSISGGGEKGGGMTIVVIKINGKYANSAIGSSHGRGSAWLDHCYRFLVEFKFVP